MTPITSAPWERAALRNSGSIAGRCPFSRGPRASRTTPSSITMWLSGGAT
jgi:hypothetical protein